MKLNREIRFQACAFALAAAGLAWAQAVYAAPPVVQIGDRILFAGGPGASPGGAFLLTDYSATSSVAKGSFLSFCIEHNEYMNFGTSLTSGPSFKVADISTEARKGGVGGVIATPYPHDPLDKRTAWLYTPYMETPTVLNSASGWSVASAIDRGTARQDSIWYI